jgi:hypothetical protein
MPAEDSPFASQLGEVLAGLQLEIGGGHDWNYLRLDGQDGQHVGQFSAATVQLVREREIAPLSTPSTLRAAANVLQAPRNRVSGPLGLPRPRVRESNPFNKLGAAGLAPNCLPPPAPKLGSHAQRPRGPKRHGVVIRCQIHAGFRTVPRSLRPDPSWNCAHRMGFALGPETTIPRCSNRTYYNRNSVFMQRTEYPNGSFRARLFLHNLFLNIDLRRKQTSRKRQKNSYYRYDV